MVLGLATVSALWWPYFDVAAIIARDRLAEASGLARARLARDSYGYFHWPMVAGIVLFAFGLETGLHRLSEPLGISPAVALCAARRCTCWRRSRSSFVPRVTSFAGGRSGRPPCSL